MTPEYHHAVLGSDKGVGNCSRCGAFLYQNDKDTINLEMQERVKTEELYKVVQDLKIGWCIICKTLDEMDQLGNVFMRHLIEIGKFSPRPGSFARNTRRLQEEIRQFPLSGFGSSGSINENEGLGMDRSAAPPSPKRLKTSSSSSSFSSSSSELDVQRKNKKNKNKKNKKRKRKLVSLPPSAESKSKPNPFMKEAVPESEEDPLPTGVKWITDENGQRVKALDLDALPLPGASREWILKNGKPTKRAKPTLMTTYELEQEEEEKLIVTNRALVSNIKDDVLTEDERHEIERGKEELKSDYLNSIQFIKV
ncbi:MAG: hypothetical protein ACTSUE_07770 [Promethearchaeota archaeon]